MEKKLSQTKKEEIIKKNKNVDGSLIDKNELLEKTLQKLGVKTVPNYSLSHPFASSKPFYFNK